MNIKKISEHVYYAGVNDRTTALFESMWPLPYGVTYNSYVVNGSERTALIDGVSASYALQLAANVDSITGGKAPDYIVINHMEPDHSGALAVLRAVYPDITIIGNSKTAEMIKGFYGITENIMVVKDGDTLSLGDVTLKFVLTPMVHWPETMMTLVEEECVLFSGDAFGCFGALNGAVVDYMMDTTHYIPEMYRYYGCIVAKYGTFVEKAINKLSGIDIRYICSTHGPVWHKRVEDIVGIYRDMSEWKAKKGVVIVYGSMYGNTLEAAELIATELAERGVERIMLHDASRSDLSYILADIMRYRGIVIASPTYNANLFPPVEYVVNALVERGIINRIIGVAGSYTWGSRAAGLLRAKLEKCKVEIVEPVVEIKQTMTEREIIQAKDMAEEMLKKL